MLTVTFVECANKSMQFVSKTKECKEREKKKQFKGSNKGGSGKKQFEKKCLEELFCQFISLDLWNMSKAQACKYFKEIQGGFVTIPSLK
jgi:hypothetical protein